MSLSAFPPVRRSSAELVQQTGRVVQLAVSPPPLGRPPKLGQQFGVGDGQRRSRGTYAVSRPRGSGITRQRGYVSKQVKYIRIIHTYRFIIQS